MLRGRDEGRGNGTKLGRSKPAGGWDRCAPAIVEAMTGASQRAATRATARALVARTLNEPRGADARELTQYISSAYRHRPT